MDNGERQELVQTPLMSYLETARKAAIVLQPLCDQATEDVAELRKAFEEGASTEQLLQLLDKHEKHIEEHRARINRELDLVFKK